MNVIDYCKAKADCRSNISCNIKNGELSGNVEDSLTDFSVGDSSSLNISSGDDEVKHWKGKYEEKEKQCKCLKRENERINIDLAHERYKCNKMQKKLQFIKDNQEIFMRLKEAYMNLKYNEATGKNIVAIHEQGVQTYEGVLCSSCVETEKLREQLLAMKAQYLNSVVMNKEDFNRMQATMTVLKAAVEGREKQWSTNMARDAQYRATILNLENENEFLRSLLKKREEDKPLKKTESGESRKGNKEIGSLKKIVVKYERKFREHCNADLKYPTFNDKEKHVIDQLMSKYYSKLSKKIESRSLSCEREYPSRSVMSCNSSYKKADSKSSSDLINNPIAMIEMLLETKCIY